MVFQEENHIIEEKSDDLNKDTTVDENICTICSSNFSTKQCLNQHIASVHIEKKPFQCSFCDVFFSLKGNLKKHEKKKPIKCPVCRLCFSQKGDLKKHIECVHEGKKTKQMLYL